MTWSKRLRLALRRETWGFGGPRIARKGGVDEQAGDDLFGHGLGTSFPSYVLPMGDADIDRMGTSA